MATQGRLLSFMREACMSEPLSAKPHPSFYILLTEKENIFDSPFSSKCIFLPVMTLNALCHLIHQVLRGASLVAPDHSPRQRCTLPLSQVCCSHCSVRTADDLSHRKLFIDCCRVHHLIFKNEKMQICFQDEHRNTAAST